MNAPMRAATFDRPLERPLARPQHLRGAGQPAGERVAGAAITVLAHVAVAAALLLACHAARVPVAPQPMMVAIDAAHNTPAKLDVIMPKFVPPPAVIAPEPVFDVAPAPNAIRVSPPRAAAPPAPPSPVAAHDTGQGRATYLGLLLAQLNRFKHYPPEARAAHIEGVVMLHFVLDHSGRVMSAEISQSSGRPMLDREALSLIARAQPLPAMPADMGDTLDAVVPINFSLRS